MGNERKIDFGLALPSARRVDRYRRRSIIRNDFDARLLPLCDDILITDWLGDHDIRSYEVDRPSYSEK